MTGRGRLTPPEPSSARFHVLSVFARLADKDAAEVVAGLGGERLDRRLRSPDRRSSCGCGRTVGRDPERGTMMARDDLTYQEELLIRAAYVASHPNQTLPVRLRPPEQLGDPLLGLEVVRHHTSARGGTIWLRFSRPAGVHPVNALTHASRVRIHAAVRTHMPVPTEGVASGCQTTVSDIRLCTSM
jgi:hypothetical protein